MARWFCAAGQADRALRTLLASVLLQAYAVLFLAGHDIGPAAISISRTFVNHAVLILGAIATVLYLGDMEHWHEFGIALSIVIFLYAVAESQDGQPAVLSALTLLGLPLLARLLQRTMLAGRLATDVLSLFALNFAAIACWSLLWWILWVGDDNRWLSSNRRKWFLGLGCDKADALCRQHAFILWGSGAILSGFCTLLTVAAALLWRSTFRVPRWVVAKLGLAAIRANASSQAAIPKPSELQPRLSSSNMGLDLSDKESMLQTAQLLIDKSFERSDDGTHALTRETSVGVSTAASASVGAIAAAHSRRDESAVAGQALGSIAEVAYTAAELQERADRLKQDAASASKVVSAVVAGLGLCIWVATAFAGADMKLTHAFTAFFVSSIVGVAVLAGAAIGYEQLLGKVTDKISPLAHVFLLWINGEYACAFGLVFGLPVFLAYLILSTVHQLIRRARAGCGCPSPVGASCEAIAADDDHNGRDGGSSGGGGGSGDGGSSGGGGGGGGAAAVRGWVTELAQRQLEVLRNWAWVSILLKANSIGLVTWALLYGSTLTYMGLAAMISWLQSMHWAVASAIFFVLGLILFLLPPVPGLAVYLTAGVLITPAAEASFGYWLACAYATVFAVVIKLVAQIMQMKLIGERLGASASVKAAVGVNSDVIKAIRHILQQPGLSLAKVCILCAGPDWPTAVLCGILRLDVLQMLIGLLPVVVITAPTTLAASFQLRIPDGGVWEPMASLMLMLATLVQLATGSIALYFIEQVKNDTSLRFEPDDEEVVQVEERAALEQRTFAFATRLAALPWTAKALLFSGTAVLIVSVHVLIFASSSCFETFALTDDVSVGMCLSCERAAVKPLGYVAFGMLFYAVVCLTCFNQAASRHVRLYLDAADRVSSTTTVSENDTVGDGQSDRTGGSLVKRASASPRTVLYERLVAGTITPSLYATAARESGVSSSAISDHLREVSSRVHKAERQSAGPHAPASALDSSGHIDLEA